MPRVQLVRATDAEDASDVAESPSSYSEPEQLSSSQVNFVDMNISDIYDDNDLDGDGDIGTR